MVNDERGRQSDVSLANDVIREYAASFERHSFWTIAYLSLFILSLSLFAFLEVWYGSYDPIVVLRLQISLAISVVLIIFVAFFWSLLARPYFQIIILERADSQRQRHYASLLQRMFRVRGVKKNKLRIDLRAASLLLFPMFLALGFTLSTILSQINMLPMFVYYDMTPAGRFINPFIPPNPPIGPFILVTALFALLSVLYLVNPKRVQRHFLALFAVPPSLLFVVLFSQISRNGPRWWSDIALGFGSTNILINEAMFVSSRLALAVILTVILYLIYHYNAKFRDFYIYLTSKNEPDQIVKAEGLLPKRVHKGDAQSIFLDLTRSELCQGGGSALDIGSNHNDLLEVEIQAAGLQIDGDKRVVACETSSLSTSTWNCSFPNAGTQAINLLISLTQAPNHRDIIFAYKHDIRVDNFLSESWKPLIAILTPIFPVVISALLR